MIERNMWDNVISANYHIGLRHILCQNEISSDKEFVTQDYSGGLNYAGL